MKGCYFWIFKEIMIPLQPQKAEIAQLVEHNLAKVGVAGPSPVFRSYLWLFTFFVRKEQILHNCRNGGIGRHEGLKIPWPVMAVRVRVPLAAHAELI